MAHFKKCANSYPLQNPLKMKTTSSVPNLKLNLFLATLTLVALFFIVPACLDLAVGLWQDLQNQTHELNNSMGQFYAAQ